MKRLIFIAYTLLFSQVAFAQFENKSFISISAGPSFPMGDFKLKDLTNEHAGFAKTGGFADITYGYKFSRYVGGMALLKGKIHGVNFSDYNLPDGSGLAMEIETTTWRSGALLAGLFTYLPLDRRGALHLTIKGLAGLQQTYSPEVKVRVSGPGFMGTSMQKSTSGQSFSYLIGTDLKYHFNDTMGLVLSFDFNSSNTQFENVKGIGRDGTFDVSSEQVTSTLNLGLGVVVAF